MLPLELNAIVDIARVDLSATLDRAIKQEQTYQVLLQLVHMGSSSMAVEDLAIGYLKLAFVDFEQEIADFVERLACF